MTTTTTDTQQHTATIADRVARGAALLDVKLPGWETEIDLDTLDIQMCTTCVVGQIFGDHADPYEYGADHLFLLDAYQYQDAPVMVAHGFAGHAPDSLRDPDVEASEWAALTAEWKRVIQQRRNRETQPRATPFLTGFDILDAYCALQNAADAHCTSLNAADRQALAYLTYWPDLRGITRMLLGKLANQTAALPLPPTLAVHLLSVAAYLPPVTEAAEDAWLAARDADTPCVVDQIIDTLAAYTAARHTEPGGHLLDGALQTVIRVGQPNLPLHQVPDAAHAHIDAALHSLDNDGLTPPAHDDPAARTLRIIAGQAATQTGPAAAALRWAMRTLIEETASTTAPVTDVEVQAAHSRVDHLIREAHRRHNTPLVLDPAARILDALAAYTADYEGDIGGGHMRTMLLTALIAAGHDELGADETVELARGDDWDPRVDVAGQRRQAMVERVKRDRLTAIDDEAVAVAL